MLIEFRKMIIPSFIRQLRQSEKGTILIEFAFVFPVTIMLLLGGFETFRLLMAERKANMTVMSVGNLISQNKILNSVAVQNIFDAVDNIMKPLELGTNGQIFVSYVTGTAAGNNIDLQCTATANTELASKLGVQNQQADLTQIAGNFTVDQYETVVISEVVYRYEPVFVNLGDWFGASMFATHDVYHIAVQKPRYGEVTFTDGCP